MSKTLSEFFGVNDVFEECKYAVQRGNLKNYRSRIRVELILKDGSRRYYRCKSIERKAAFNEILTFIKAVENATNEQVIWRFKGDSTYYMGSNVPIEKTKSRKLKVKIKRFLDYFFDLED